MGQQGKLLPDEGIGSGFGRRLALDGDTALVSVRFEDGVGENSGACYVFTRTGSVWAQQTKLVPEDPHAEDFFGSAVALDGDVALIGATGHDAQGQNAGAAYVFVRSGGIWTQQARLHASDGWRKTGFGHDIDLEGDSAMIGANKFNGLEHGCGLRIHPHRRHLDRAREAGGIRRRRRGRLRQLDHAARRHGARRCGMVGRNGRQLGIGVRVHPRSDGWVEQAKLLPSDGDSGDRFAGAVAFEGNTAILGAFQHDHDVFASGSAYVFRVLGGDDVPAMTAVGAVLLALAMMGVGVYVSRSMKNPLLDERPRIELSFVC